MDRIHKKILIIDDEAVFREELADALTRCGSICQAVENPGDGVRRLKYEHFDLVLLDIMMDPLDGWDTLDLIKNVPGSQKIPVVMSSAKSIFADEIIRFGDQISGFIKKPFDPEEICEDITSFFSWYDSLVTIAGKAASSGVPEDVCDHWFLLSRQIHAFGRLKEIASTRCIPDDSMTEEECNAQKIAEINRIVDEKILQRDQIISRYPVFTTAANP